MSNTQQAIDAHLAEYVEVIQELAEKLNRPAEDLQPIINLVSIVSGDLPQRTAEFLLCLATVCPNLKLTEL